MDLQICLQRESEERWRKWPYSKPQEAGSHWWENNFQFQRKYSHVKKRKYNACSIQEKSLTSWAKISTPWPQSVRCPFPPGNTLVVGFEKIATSDPLEFNWENMFILQNLFSKNHDCTDLNFDHQRRSDVMQKYVSKNMNISNVRTRSRKTVVGFQKNFKVYLLKLIWKYVHPIKTVQQKFTNHCQDKVTEGEEQAGKQSMQVNSMLSSSCH